MATDTPRRFALDFGNRIRPGYNFTQAHVGSELWRAIEANVARLRVLCANEDDYEAARAEVMRLSTETTLTLQQAFDRVIADKRRNA